MNLCDRCHTPLGPAHACIDITTFGDTQRRYLPLYANVQHVSPELTMRIASETHSRQVHESLWSRVWAFVKEAW